MADVTVVVGIDVGGTNTDAVVLEQSKGTANVLAAAKTLTTADITSGVKEAIRTALLKLEDRFTKVGVLQVNIGTTHFINAVVEGKRLAKVAVIRLCGTASKRLPPFCDFTESIVEKIKGSVFLTSGGYQFDGQEITEVDKTEIVSVLAGLKERGERHIVVSGIFSPVRPDQEDEVVELIQKHYPEASVTASKSIGRLGLLERENAAILNECIKPLCSEAISGFRASLKDLGLDCPMYLTQNDGTILSEDMALQFPVHTFASGATNSMRGAAFLSGLQDALVIDIGGTSTDVGVLLKGFPRHASSEVKVGGIRTNFRMPDVISIGLGGGSYVSHLGNKVKVGPLSAGYNILEEAYVFAKKVDTENKAVTATDIAVAAGIACVGNAENVQSIPKEMVRKGVNVIHEMLTDCLDQMRFNDRDLPLILVGGGSILVDLKDKFSGVSSIIKPDHFDVANAVGAALSQVSATVDDTVELERFIISSELEEKVKYELGQATEKSDETEQSIKDRVKKEFLTAARDKALTGSIELGKRKVVEAGGAMDTVELLDKDDIPISYIPGHTRIKVKVVAELKADAANKCDVTIEALKNKTTATTEVKQKQIATTTGKLLEEKDFALRSKQTPNIDGKTGEWLLNEYDIECISIGAGILGTGGGGNPHLGKLSGLKALKDGKRLRVITPSKFFDSAYKDTDLTVIVAFMGAPLVFYEKLMSGNETKGALEALQDLYNIGHYKNGELLQKEGVEIGVEEGVSFIDDYKPKGVSTHGQMGERKVTAVMSAEIGGMNCIEPLIVGAELDVPVLDCDGMGRAFPELQMFAPFMYGCDSFPSTIADDKGKRSIVLKSSDAKRLEDCFRRVVISMGCSGGVVLSHFTKDQVLKYTVQHSLSFAWRIGDTVMQARKENKSPVDEVIKCTNGKVLINGKLSDVKREISGGFSKGMIKVDGLENFSGQTVSIDFQNEFLVARAERNNKLGEVLVCVPDLITVLDIDTAQPISTDEVHYGMRVSVVAMPVAPLMATEEALKWVGPQAFGYPEEIKYKPISKYAEHEPVGPM